MALEREVEGDLLLGDMGQVSTLVSALYGVKMLLVCVIRIVTIQYVIFKHLWV